MRIVLLLLLTGSLISIANAEPELKGSPSELANYLAAMPRTVVLSGEAELKVPADKALVTLRVRTENRLLEEAIRNNEQVRIKIVAALKQRGIPLENIKVSKFSSTPKHSMFGDKVKSYTVENTVQITARDEKEFQAAAQVADGSAEVFYDGIEFEHSDKEAWKTKAKAQACDNADANRKIYAAKLGVRLTPKSFSESGETMPVPRRQASGYPSYLGAESMRKQAVSELPNRRDDADESVSSFGELTFKARVAVEYIVER